MGCVKSQNINQEVGVPSRNPPAKSENMESNVLQKKVQYREFKEIIIPYLQKQTPIRSFELVFRASEKGFSAVDFHTATDQVCNTLLLFRTKKGNVFGGYTPCPWKNQLMYSYETDLTKKSFLFRLSIAEQEEIGPQLKDVEAKIFKLKTEQQAIMNHEGNGPIFGKGHDLLISDNCNTNESWATLGKSYFCQFPHASNKANKFLCGQTRFFISQFEVWTLKV